MAAREQRVTPLEVFFDLVFVFAITQVTLLNAGRPDVGRARARATALVTGLCCGLIAYDVIHYRDARAEIRQARP